MTMTEKLILALKDRPDQAVRSLVDNYLPHRDDVKVRRRLMVMKDKGLVTRREVSRAIPTCYTANGKRGSRTPRPQKIWLWRAKEAA
jgi:hypothetical protein